jgi:hypothetical protein
MHVRINELLFLIWLRAGGSGDEIPARAIFSTPVQTSPGAHLTSCTMGKGKGKVFPLQAWAGPCGSGRLRLWIFSNFGTVKVVTSSPLRTGHLYPQQFSWHSFLEAKSTPRHMVPSLASERISSDTNGDRSRDPPASSAVPWPLRYRVYFPG